MAIFDTIPSMPADTPGRRLKVVAAGLHQLGNTCEKISGELSTDAKPPSLGKSGWQSSATTAHTAATGAGKDLAAIATRIGTRGTYYNTAGTAYTQTEHESAAKLRKLDH